MSSITLIKVGGAELQEGPELEALADVLAALSQQARLVVVHGGGPEIAKWQERIGLQPRFVEGLRVTDEASLAIAEMVLSGAVNKRLTARLVQRGVRAIGLSGVDAGLLRAARMQHPAGDLGRVGEIRSVATALLTGLLDLGLLPVVSPISLGDDGRALNVNADHAAAAIGSALGVREAVFLTNVSGVLQDGQLLATLDAPRARQLIAEGVISGGMIPKVRSALAAVDRGIAAVRITNLQGLAAGTGTALSLSSCYQPTSAEARPFRPDSTHDTNHKERSHEHKRNPGPGQPICRPHLYTRAVRYRARRGRARIRH